MGSILMSKTKRESSSAARQPLKRLRLDENSLVMSQHPDEECSPSVEKDKEHDREETRVKLEKFMTLADNHKLRENLWENEAIDLFLKFSLSNDKLDYRFSGHCLSAVVKLYLLRIDTLYEEVTRFHALFIRRDNKSSRQKDIDNDQHRKPYVSPQRQQRRQLVRKSTTIADPKSLNAKLITTPAIDPFFAKLNTFVGTTKANRMLQNLLSSRNSSLKVSVNERFWDSEDQIINNSCFQEPICVEVPLRHPESLQFKVIRTTLDEYRLTTECLDEFRITSYVNLCESDTEMEVSGNDEVPMSEDDSASDTSMFYHEFETETDKFAFVSTPAPIRALDSGYLTQGLDQKIGKDLESQGSAHECDINDESEAPRELILDLEPIDNQQREYSYRPTDLVENFYMSPCYWKFLKQSRTCSAPRRRRAREKVSLTSLRNFDFSQLSIQKDDITKRVETKEWSRGALKLPQDFKLQPGIFEGFQHSGLSMDDPFLDVAPGDEDFEHDEASCDDSFHTMVAEPTPDRLEVTPKNVSGFRLSQNRPVNMKYVKEMSMVVIENEACVTQCSAVKFSAVNSKVDKLLSQEAEKSSCALIFLSLLHAAGEKKIELKTDNEIDDFTIVLKP